MKQVQIQISLIICIPSEKKPSTKRKGKWKFLMVVVMLMGRMIVLISMLVISQKKLKWNETDGKWVGKIGNCIQREWIRCNIFVWYREMDENGKYLYHVMCHAPEHFRVFYLYLCISLPEWLVPWCEGHIYFTVTFTSLDMERTLLELVVLVVCVWLETAWRSCCQPSFTDEEWF